MDAPSAWEELEIDDLPSDDLRWLARHHGKDVAVALWRRCAGTSLDFPLRLPRAYAMRYIRKYFTGNNVRQLARSLGLSERTVQEYAVFNGSTAKRAIPQDQLAMF